MTVLELLAEESVSESVSESAPAWIVEEMPPGYQNRVAEIQRLTEELRVLERCGGLLWQVGDTLAEGVLDAFVAMGYNAELTVDSAGKSVIVKLDARRRLLLRASTTKGVIQKKDTELAQIFRLVHELAEDGDRVVLITNSDPETRPADRLESLGPEALNILGRLGANVISGPTLFALWSMSLHDRERAQKHIDRLHEQDGGTFAVPTKGSR